MRIEIPGRRSAFRVLSRLVTGLLFALVLAPGVNAGGRVRWLDDVVRQAVRQSDETGAGASRRAASVGRLFEGQAEESLEALARRSAGLGRVGGSLEAPSEAALRVRFERMAKPDPAMHRTFQTLEPAEKRLVVELGETAVTLARKAGPNQAEPMLKALGVDGLAAVRTYGDDVAETIVREGPAAVDVLRKTGRPGWRFYTQTVLKHKKKLAAAGVLAVFLADPDRFIDTTGQVTEFAVEQFAKAGIALANAVGGGAARGVESAVTDELAKWGLRGEAARIVGLVLAGTIAIGAVLVLFGLPLRWLLAPVLIPMRAIVFLIRTLTGKRPRPADSLERRTAPYQSLAGKA